MCLQARYSTSREGGHGPQRRFVLGRGDIGISVGGGGAGGERDGWIDCG